MEGGMIIYVEGISCDMIIYVEGISWSLQTSNEENDIIEFQLHHQG